jgi:hypothetical protein
MSSSTHTSKTNTTHNTHLLSFSESLRHHLQQSAKSGADYRLTRIGATETRLKKYAAATDYRLGFLEDKIEKACLDNNLELQNPEGEGDSWYPPYKYLYGPYEDTHPELYRPFNEGDLLTNFQRLLSADTNLKGVTKGCGFNFPDLNSATDDNEFCKAIFVLHNDETRDALAAKWLPLDWPWNLPKNEISQYFGREMGFYFAFLGHLTSGLLPVAVLALAAQVHSWFTVGWLVG